MAIQGKYDPIEYLKQQLANYSKQFAPAIAESGKAVDTAKTAKGTSDTAAKKAADAIANEQAKAKAATAQRDQLNQQKTQLDQSWDAANKSYAAAVSSINNLQKSIDNDSKLLGYSQQFLKKDRPGTASYNQHKNEIAYYTNTINSYQKQKMNAANQRDQFQAQKENIQKQAATVQNNILAANKSLTAINDGIKGLQTAMTKNQGDSAAQQKAIDAQLAKQGEIDKQIEGFKGSEGPKTELGAQISGKMEDSIAAAKEAAKGIAGSQSDVDKSNLSNLLSKQAEDIAKTFGGNPEDIKKQLDPQQFFQPGQMPEQMNAQQFQDYMGKAMAQKGPELGARKLEAGQIVGGTAEDQARLAAYNQPAQEQAHQANVQQDETKAAFEQSEQQRQQQLGELRQQANQQFSQAQKDYYKPGEGLNEGVFQKSADFEKFQNAPSTQPATPPPAQPAQTGGPGSLPPPPPGQIPVGPMGNFNGLMQNAVRGQIQQGFQRARQPQPNLGPRGAQVMPQTQKPAAQPQGQQILMGNVQRQVTPRPQQRGQPGQQGPGMSGNQFQGYGQRPGQPPLNPVQPNQRGAFGNRYQPVMAQSQPQQPSMDSQNPDQRVQQVQKNAMDLAKTQQQKSATQQGMGMTDQATRVNVKGPEANPYNQQQNVQMSKKDTNVNRTAGMRMPR